MQAVGEKQGETHTAYGTCRPMQFKISLTVETCYEKMRRWLTVGCQLGCLATTNGSMVTHRFLSLPLPLVTPTPSLPSPPFLRMEQRSGEKLRLLLHEQYQHQISMQWFFFFFCPVSQVQHGKHHHHQQQQMQVLPMAAWRLVGRIMKGCLWRDGAHICMECAIKLRLWNTKKMLKDRISTGMSNIF